MAKAEISDALLTLFALTAAPLLMLAALVMPVVVVPLAIVVGVVVRLMRFVWAVCLGRSAGRKGFAAGS